MKASLNGLEEDYLGDYIQEFRKAGLMSEKMSIKDTLKNRRKMIEGEIVKVDIAATHFNTQLELMKEALEKTNMGYSQIVRDFKRIETGLKKNVDVYATEYERIIDAVEEVYNLLETQGEISDEKWEEYRHDCTLIVAYAKTNIFDVVFETKYRKALDEKQRRAVRNFYAEIAQNTTGIDIKNITVNYSDESKNRKFKIESPILLKMMLYEFARKYYMYIERENEENWENTVVLYKENAQSGSPGYDHTVYLNSLIRVYEHIFIDNSQLFSKVKAIKRKYLLLGKLLTIAGYSKYSEDNGDYSGEADYYYKKLKIKDVTEGT